MERKTLFTNDVWTLCRFKPNWLFVVTKPPVQCFKPNRLYHYKIVSVILCKTKALSPTTFCNLTLNEKRLTSCDSSKFDVSQFDVERKTTLTSCDSSKVGVFKSAFEMGIFGLESYVEKNCRDAFYEVDIRLLIEKYFINLLFWGFLWTWHVSVYMNETS